MADNTAGSVNIDIKGNIAPFEAALAKARQMADLFDSQVSQKLGGNSATEAGLAKIAAAVDQTNAILAKMAGVTNTTDAALVKLSGDATKASASIAEVKTTSTAATAAVGNLSTQVNSATASIQRAVAANQSFAASNLQMSNGTAARAEDIQAYGAALDDIRAKYNPLFAVTRQYLVTKEEIRLANKLGAISEGEAASAISRERQETLAAIAVLKGHTTALQGHGAAAGLGATQTMALMHAVRGFTEQVAMGISPLRAATTEMNHLTYAMSGPGGPRAALSAIGSTIGTVASKIAQFVANSSLIRAVGVAAGAVAIGFGAIRDAASEAENRTVGWGETFLATFQVIKNDLVNQFGPAIQTAISPIKYALQQLASAAVDIAELVINSFHAAFTDILTDWRTLPDQFGAFFVGAANAGIAALNTLVKGASDAVDKISVVMNNIPGVNIPLLNAKDQTIAPLDNKYLDNLKKAVADRNAAIDDIMKQTPLRDFGKQVVDQIATNHALEGLDALSKISFDKATSSANGLSSAIGGIGKAASGVTVEYGGMSQQIINVSRAFEDAKRNNLINLEQSSQQLQELKNQAEDIQKTLKAAGAASVDTVFGDHFTGSAREAKAAIDGAVSSVDKLFKAMDTGNISTRDFQSSLDMVRATLKAMGGDPRAIDAFINEIINGQLKVRQLNSDVLTLGDTIKSLPNKTVTITVVTKQVGSGTQSIYDVPNSSGGTSGVGVTRYGGVAGQQSGPSLSAYSVPSTGYGSMGGSADSSTGTVTVTRFGGTRAAGGPVGANTPYWVGEHGPELVVPTSAGSVVPNSQSTALANAQSGFTGTQATKENDRYWVVLMNIEAATRKTAQLLDEIKAAGASFASSGSGSSSSSASSAGSSDSSAYAQILKQVKANFAAAGIVGGGSIGYGGQGLAATPEQIARAIVNGTASSVGSVGANDYENTLTQTQISMQQQEARRHKAIYGFAPGGMIGGDGGDTQKVEFFKNPNEKVIIARPDQFADVRPGTSSTGSAADSRPISITMHNNWNGNAQPSKDSLAAIRQQTALGIRDALRSVNGR